MLLPFSTFHNFEIPLTEIISGRIGFIHDLFLTFPFEVRDTLPEGDRDLVLLAGKKERRARMLELAEYPGRVVLVLAPGDAPVRAAYMPNRRSIPPNVLAAFATNNELADARVTSVPLGVRINKLRTLQFVRQNHRGGRNGLLYGNFTVYDEFPGDEPGAPHVRVRLAEQLSDAPWAKLDISSDKRDTPEELVDYYSQTAGHKFALSPEGNGVDCYRTWESLYLGAIPIVRTSATMSAFARLPILFTENYEELTEDWLEQRWEEMSSRSFEVDRVLKSFYLHRFLEAVSSLRDPLFICWKVADSPSEKFVRVLERSSRSASGIVTETPKLPLIARRSLMKPDNWRMPGALKLVPAEEGLALVIDSGGPAIAESSFRTIAGGPFRLSGSLQPRTDRHGGLRLTLRDGSGVLTSTEFDGAQDAPFDVDFVAKSDRTVLVIELTTGESDVSWLLRDLSLHVDV